MDLSADQEETPWTTPQPGSVRQRRGTTSASTSHSSCPPGCAAILVLSTLLHWTLGTTALDVTPLPFGAVILPLDEARSFTSTLDVVLVRSHPRETSALLSEAVNDGLSRLLQEHTTGMSLGFV